MEARNMLVTVECFVKKGKKYLLLHLNKNKRIMPDVWMAPGGKVDFNEGLFACARREVFEETGLEVSNFRLKIIGNAYLKDLDQELHCHFILADYKSGEVKQNPEDGALVWLTPAEIGKSPNLLAEIHNLLPYLFTKDAKLISYTSVYEKGNEMSEFKLEETR